MLDAEPCIEEGLHEAAEREVHATDSGPEPAGRELRRECVSPRLPVSGAQCRKAALLDEGRVWADETGVGTDIDERAAGAQDANDLAEQEREVVDVGMRPDRDDRVELFGPERKVCRVG